MRLRSVLTGLLATVALGAGAGLAYGYGHFLPSGRALPGTFVGGRLQPAEESLGDWLERRRVELGSRQAYLELPDGDGNVAVKFAALGVELDVGETMRVVHRHAREGSLGARLHRARVARRGETDLPLAFRFDRERARQTLARLAPHVRREPTDARLELENYRRVDDVPGRELDVEGTLTLIADAERGEDAVIPVWTREARAAVTSEMLANVDVSKVLGAYETDFRYKPRSRDTNIRKAAEYLNGTVLAPGQTLSFNEVVGPRRIDRGFTWAPVIIADELEPGVGGGACQVASTLHAAAVLGRLHIQERRSHSRPSGYAPLGLDATVVYGEVDLKIKNTSPTPLILHAFLPTPYTIRVEFLGAEPVGKVEHTYAVIRTHDFYRRVWTKPHLSEGKSIKRQRGIKGYDVLSVVRTRFPDGRSEETRYFSWYRPVPEVFWIGPGTNEADLPELPDGARHVEVDGQKRGEEPTAGHSGDSADVVVTPG
ncbi:MAG: VanW family protein [Polyangiaceae bacterium]|nr:VanW family protein [Polyangiaceae bacterium]